MSMSLGATSARGVFTPGYSLTGRRLTACSKANRSFSSRPRSRTPDGTPGSPTAPSRIASCPRSSSSTLSGSVSPVRCHRAAPRSYVVVSTLTSLPTAASSTFRPSATTSPPMPSPGMTASRISRCLPSPGRSRPASPAIAALPLAPAAQCPARPCRSPPTPVDRAHQRMQRRRRDARVDSAAPQDPAIDGNFEARRGLRLLAGAGRMLVVVENSRVDVDRCKGVHQGRDRTVALAADGVLDTVQLDVRRDAVDHPAVHRVAEQLKTTWLEIAVLVELPDPLGRNLTAELVRLLLHDPRELDLHPARHVEAVVVLEDVGDTALAGLGVDPDDCLVGTPDILRVDRQVRHAPGEVIDRHDCGGGVALQRIEPLLDGVLVRTAEGRVDEVTSVGVPGVDRQLVAVLDRATYLVDVGEVDA